MTCADDLIADVLKELQQGGLKLEDLPFKSAASGSELHERRRSPRSSNKRTSRASRESERKVQDKRQYKEAEDKRRSNEEDSKESKKKKSRSRSRHRHDSAKKRKASNNRSPKKKKSHKHKKHGKHKRKRESSPRSDVAGDEGASPSYELTDTAFPEVKAVSMDDYLRSKGHGAAGEKQPALPTGKPLVGEFAIRKEGVEPVAEPSPPKKKAFVPRNVQMKAAVAVEKSPPEEAAAPAVTDESRASSVLASEPPPAPIVTVAPPAEFSDDEVDEESSTSSRSSSPSSTSSPLKRIHELRAEKLKAASAAVDADDANFDLLGSAPKVDRRSKKIAIVGLAKKALWGAASEVDVVKEGATVATMEEGEVASSAGGDSGGSASSGEDENDDSDGEIKSDDGADGETKKRKNKKSGSRKKRQRERGDEAKRRRRSSPSRRKDTRKSAVIEKDTTSSSAGHGRARRSRSRSVSPSRRSSARSERSRAYPARESGDRFSTSRGAPSTRRPYRRDWSSRVARRRSSRSPSRRTQRSRSKTPDPDHIDKQKLYEIARRNTTAMLQSGNLQHIRSLSAEEIAKIRAGGKSIDELVDYCKKITKNEDDVDVRKHSDDETDFTIHHPFSLKPSTGPLILNIPGGVPLPVKTPSERAKDETILRLTFPVSSGQQHRTKESEWVPVEKEEGEEKLQLSIGYDEPLALTDIVMPAEMSALPPPPPPPAPAQHRQQRSDTVFPLAIEGPSNVGDVIGTRLKAIRRLQDNPHDAEALKLVHCSEEQLKNWAESKVVPGAFTGSTGVMNILTPEELGPVSRRHQAWTRRDQLTSSKPVDGGMGKYLLQKMGWRPGEGLGKNREGTTQPLLVDIKNDRKGLVAEEELPAILRKEAPTTPLYRDLQGKHPVSALMELCSRRRWGPPSFTCEESMAGMGRRFLWKVVVNGVEYQPAMGIANKKEAKAQTAQIVLQSLGLVPRNAALPVIIA